MNFCTSNFSPRSTNHTFHTSLILLVRMPAMKYGYAIYVVCSLSFHGVSDFEKTNCFSEVFLKYHGTYSDRHVPTFQLILLVP